MNEALARKVTQWNEKTPTGTTVVVRRDDGTEFITQTRSGAELLSGHTPVIWLVGVAGCYLLDRVRVA